MEAVGVRVYAAEDIKILELRINESLRRAKRWLDSRHPKMSFEKTKASLVTDRSIRSCFMELGPGLVPYEIMLSRKYCPQQIEVLH